MRTLPCRIRSLSSSRSLAKMAAKATKSDGGERRKKKSFFGFVDRNDAKISTSSPSSSPASGAPPPPSLLCRLGVIADVQAADRDDAPSFSGVTRRYRDALLTARDSARSLAADDEVDFLLHLGDLVDMSEASGKPREVLSQVLSALAESEKEQAHVLGNHCLASWPGTRAELHSELGLLAIPAKQKKTKEEKKTRAISSSPAPAPSEATTPALLGKTPKELVFA